jgi:cyanate permease
LGILSPLLVGGMKDATGTYVPAFLLMVGVAVAGAVCSVLAKPPLPEVVGTAQVVLDSPI